MASNKFASYRMSLLFCEVALALILVGCATEPVPLTVSDLDRSAGMKVEDLRPKSESEREIFSLLISSDAYGISRIKDGLTTPSGPRLFAHRAYLELKDKSPSTAVRLHHFVIYNNSRSSLRATAVSTSLAIILGSGSVVTPTITADGMSHSLVDEKVFVELAEEEYKRALYTEAEAPEHSSVLVIYIESEVGSVRKFTRTVAPIRETKGPPSIQLAIESALDYHFAPEK